MGRSLSKKRLGYVVVAAVIAAGLLLLTAWRSGAFYLKELITSPDGAVRAAVYERPFPWSSTHDVPEEYVPTTSVAFNGDLTGSTTNFPYTTYVDAWWSPDSRKFLIKMDALSDTAISMELIDFDTGSSTTLSLTVPSAMMAADLNGAGFQENNDGQPVVDLQPLQWSENSDAIALRYAFTDITGNAYSGTLWYWFDGFPIGEVKDIVPDV